MEDEATIFSAKNMYMMSHTQNGRLRSLLNEPRKSINKKMHENMHLMEGLTFTKEYGMPMLSSYNGTIDFEIVSYTERKKHNGKNSAIHFFLDDYRFRTAVWEKLEKTTSEISKFDYVFTPDLSMWADLPTNFYNKENLFRTRFIGAYWQKCGFNVIPTASWGDLNSFEYCFDGLPESSVVAASGMGSRRSTTTFDRWCYGLQRLEDAKRPTTILVYGEEVDVHGLHTPLKFLPCFIQKRLRIL